MDKRALIIFAVIFIVIIFAALFILSLSRSVQNRRQEAVTKVVNRDTIPVVDVIQDPLVYDGLTIQVENLIVDWVTKESFTLSTGVRGGLISGGDRRSLLIITKNPMPLPKDAGENEVGLGELAIVKVTGKARIMDRTELGRALGVDLDEENSDIYLDDNDAIQDWEQGTVILAETIEKL